MAKILSVELQEIPDTIVVNDNDTDITVEITIEFHPIDLKLEMEYILQLFVYDIHGSIDVPFIIANWDESQIHPVIQDGEDDFLGERKQKIKAIQKQITVNIPMILKLGKLNTSRGAYLSRQLEVFASMTPALGRSSKWSKPFETQILY